VLRWVNPEKARYYQADLVEDLFGAWIVITAWGGMESHRGQVRSAVVASRDAGLECLKRIERYRRKRGYIRSPDLFGLDVSLAAVFADAEPAALRSGADGA
jgi:hypothetical protein